MNKSTIIIMAYLTSIIILICTQSGVAVIPTNEAVEINVSPTEYYNETFHIDPNPIDIEIELNISYSLSTHSFNILIAKAEHEDDKNITPDSQIVLNETLFGPSYASEWKLYIFSLDTTNSTYIVQIKNNATTDLELFLTVWVEYGPARIDVFRRYLGLCILLVLIICVIIILASFRRKS